MIGSNVNNSISHPPHPRRAVPANLPPGAFLFFHMGVYLRVFSLFPFFIFLPLWCLGNPGADLSQRIAELRLKSNAHGRYVNDLLANEVRTDPIIPPASSSLPDRSSVQTDEPLNLPNVDLPDVVDDVFLGEPNLPTVSSTEDTLDSDSMEEKKGGNAEVDVQSLPAFPEGVDPAVNQRNPTYDDLYAPKVAQRRIGYYFGPFIGPVFPDDSAVRNSQGHYQSKGGITAGLRLGKDFGSARIEGEYSFLSHKIHSDSQGSGNTNFHNLNSRLILEKNLAERADIRAGIGLGVGFISKDLGGYEYDGIGFTYDFLLGWSFRVMNNWSLNMDYRHYLTAAHKDFDRLQGHIIELSAGFDL